MDESDSVSRWIDELRAGSDDAATRIWKHYYARLIGLAKTRLKSFPRRSFDEDDIVLKAIDDCFRGLQEGRYPDLRDRHELWWMLIRITENETKTRVRREKREKRGDGGVRGDSALSNSEGDAHGFDKLPGTEPTPEFIAEMTENFRRLLEALEGTEQHRNWKLKEIAIWKLSGCNNGEIGEKLDRKLRTVERRLALIREIWSQESE